MVNKKLTGDCINDTIPGHIHSGLGRYHTLGGITEQRPIWIDLVFRAALSLDGNTILEDGSLKISTEFHQDRLLSPKELSYLPSQMLALAGLIHSFFFPKRKGEYWIKAERTVPLKIFVKKPKEVML